MMVWEQKKKRLMAVWIYWWQPICSWLIMEATPISLSLLFKMHQSQDRFVRMNVCWGVICVLVSLDENHCPFNPMLWIMHISQGVRYNSEQPIWLHHSINCTWCTSLYYYLEHLIFLNFLQSVTTNHFQKIPQLLENESLLRVCITFFQNLMIFMKHGEFPVICRRIEYSKRTQHSVIHPFLAYIAPDTALALESYCLTAFSRSKPS